MEGLKIIKHIKWNGEYLEILDQTRLPQEMIHIRLNTPGEVAEAIKNLRIRGAPAIGIAAAYGLVLGIKNSSSSSYSELESEIGRIADLLADARPTAVNLVWALGRIKRRLEGHSGKDIPTIKKALEEEAVNIHDDDKVRCQRIGEHGAGLIKNGNTILTHCNAGSLATGGIGTALGIIYTAHKQGKRIGVIATETRPLLQGARLTTYELREAGIKTTLICDTMIGAVMKEGRLNLCIVGADRIAANGDTANKIGTYQIAIMAKYHNIPFYVAAPISTIDLSLKDGSLIPIEERASEEVVCGFGRRIAPEEIEVYNPAFDVTPAKLISAIITENGITRPPYTQTLPAISSLCFSN